MASSITRRQALVAATALAVVPSAASATNRYSVISISNETQVDIGLSWHWADPGWKHMQLAPGANHWWSHKYDHPNENRSPDFELKFDSDGRTGSTYSETKVLRGHAAPEQNFDLGHKYVFRYDGPSKRYIKLMDVG
jgi:hypothetical protein